MLPEVFSIPDFSDLVARNPLHISLQILQNVPTILAAPLCFSKSKTFLYLQRSYLILEAI